MTRFQKRILALAKAMEQGCKKTRPIRGDYLTDDNGKVYACALGAALVNGFSIKSSIQLAGKYGYVGALRKRQPVASQYDGNGNSTLGNEIVRRNDELMHTRQRIAKWLRRVAKLPEPPNNWSDVK